MDELGRQGIELCYDRSALLSYSSYYSGNDLEDYVKGEREALKTRRMERQVCAMF
jgi:hypothetical protein